MYLEIDEGLYAMDDINYIDYVKSDNCLIVVFKIDPKNPTTAMLQGSEADKIWKICGAEKRFCVCGEKLFNLQNINDVKKKSKCWASFTDGRSLNITESEYNAIKTAKKKYDFNQQL